MAQLAVPEAVIAQHLLLLFCCECVGNSHSQQKRRTARQVNNNVLQAQYPDSHSARSSLQQHIDTQLDAPLYQDVPCAAAVSAAAQTSCAAGRRLVLSTSFTHACMAPETVSSLALVPGSPQSQSGAKY
jgi:hypothetical protein